MKANSIHRTGIPYLTHAWPIVTGCLPDRPCWRRCWARAMAHRFGRDFTPTFHPEILDVPLRTRAKGSVIGVVFGGDLFVEGIENGQIAAVFGVMAARPDLMFVVLTKRPDRMATWFGEWIPERIRHGREFFPDDDDGWMVRQMAARECMRLGTQLPPHHGGHWPLPNVYPGFSAWDQDSFDSGWRAMVPLAAEGWRVWCSLEPMIGAVAVSEAMPLAGFCYGGFPGGDPRKFHPDPDCSTAAERRAHSKACAAWANGERPTIPVSGLEITEDGPAFVERSGYGLGSYDFVTPGLSGIILGAESGPGARPLDLAWVRTVRDQCRAAGVPFALKQASKGAETREVQWMGRTATVPVLDGATWTQTPWGGREVPDVR